MKNETKGTVEWQNVRCGDNAILWNPIYNSKLFLGISATGGIVK